MICYNFTYKISLLLKDVRRVNFLATKDPLGHYSKADLYFYKVLDMLSFRKSIYTKLKIKSIETYLEARYNSY